MPSSSPARGSASRGSLAAAARSSSMPATSSATASTTRRRRRSSSSSKGSSGRRVGRGRTGVVTVSTGEASLIADLAPRTGIDLPDVPAATRERLLDDLPTLGYIGNPLDPWGATEPAAAYAAAFGAFAESGAYDVLAIVHDFPYRSLPSEIETASQVTDQLLRATEDRQALLHVHISLYSGEAPGETKAQLDAAGGVPILRGALEAVTAIAAVA